MYIRMMNPSEHEYTRVEPEIDHVPKTIKRGLKELYGFGISARYHRDFKSEISKRKLVKLEKKSNRRIKKYLNSLGSIPRTIVISNLWSKYYA